MKKLLVFLVMFGIAAAGAAYWISSGRNGSDEGYSFESVKFGTMTDVVNATGIVKPKQIFLVFCKTPGTVEEIIGKVGQKVEKGQPLFKVNPEMAKLTLERAKAAKNMRTALRESAKAGLEYQNKIMATGSVSITKERELEVQTKYDAAVAGEAEADSALKQAELAMDWTTVKAPISGIIIDKNLYLGQPVGPSPTMGGGGGGSSSGLGQSGLGGPSAGASTSSLLGISELRVPFIIASDLGDLEVYAQISQGDIGRVKAGLKAQFTVDAFPEKPFVGEITDINLMPVSVPGATFYPAVINVRNDKADGDWILRPGMSVNVDITCDVHTNVWKLPSAATSLPPFDPRQITQAAQEKLDTRKNLKPPHDEWVVVWEMRDKKPWPIFVRVGGKRDDGKPGIKESNSNYIEVLEWDSTPSEKEWVSKLDRNNEKTYPQLIIAAPQPKPSIFEGKIKI
jgi:HlyD family secretion protein